MATREKENLVEGHEMVIAQRCMERLNCMKNGPKDERPKTKQALKNVLGKETSLLYVSSVLSAVYEYPYAVNFSEVDDVFRSDSDLDRDIARIVSGRCRREGRPLFVLPCDSDMHATFTAQIKEWYSQKDALFDRDNPTDSIAKACYLDHTLSADELYNKIVHFGYIKPGVHDDVTLQFPDEAGLNALETGIKQWEEKIIENLRDLTVRYYQCFAEIVIQANAAIQHVAAKDIGHYCEVEYFKRYPYFKSTTVESYKVGGMIGRLSVEDMDVGQADKNDASADDDAMEVTLDIPAESVGTLPLNLHPEVAYALVHLGKVKTPLHTSKQVITQIESMCNITYIVSPKYALSSFATKARAAEINRDNFTMQLHLGKTVSKKKKDVSEITQLAMLLSFPGQSKIFKRYNRQLERIRRYHSVNPSYVQQPVTVSLDDINELLKGFQLHIFKRSKEMAQRRRATVVLNDPNADANCKRNLFKLLDDANKDPNVTLTEEEFSRQLIELSYDEAYMPSDAVIQKLADLGYLSINNEEIRYQQSYKFHRFINDNAEIRKFIGRWKTDQKPRDNSQPREGQLPVNSDLGKKRSIGGGPLSGGKRAKILDL